MGRKQGNRNDGDKRNRKNQTPTSHRAVLKEVSIHYPPPMQRKKERKKDGIFFKERCFLYTCPKKGISKSAH